MSRIHPHADPVVKYHAKYLVADDGPALVASLNFTRKCFAKTIDAIVITHDPDVVSGLRDLITADCSGGPMPDAVVASAHRRSGAGASPVHRDHRAGAIEHPAHRQESVGSRDDRRCCSSVARPACAWTLYDGKRLCDLRSHGKVMLVDDTLAVVGGLSLNPMSLDFRREVAVTVTEPSAVARGGESVRGRGRERGGQGARRTSSRGTPHAEWPVRRAADVAAGRTASRAAAGPPSAASAVAQQAPRVRDLRVPLARSSADASGRSCSAWTFSASFSGTPAIPVTTRRTSTSTRFIAPASGSRARSSDHVQFSVERELTEREADDRRRRSRKPAWKDVYVDANFSDAAQVRVGQVQDPVRTRADHRDHRTSTSSIGR